jgi:hypothetical protein
MTPEERAAYYGRPMTDERRAKIAAGVRKHFKEHPPKPRVGWAHTPKTKAKLRDIGKQMFADGRRKADFGVSSRWDSKTGSILRRAQLKHEAEQADKLRADGYEVYSPTAVCDRIAIKDGRVFFVEFKLPGQLLREGQQRVRDSDPERYVIVYAPIKSEIGR